ncbi:MAG: cupin domain-containing protein, partial [Terracidiphilus sp.]
AHTPVDVLQQNFDLPAASIGKLPSRELFIFPAPVPPSLAQDRSAIGGEKVASRVDYTFNISAMQPTRVTPGGEVRIVDTRLFPASTTIAAALVTLRPGGLRELHWHPTGPEWQFYLSGSARMTVFVPANRARTMDFNANDVGFVPAMAGHYIQNTGSTDLVFLEILRSSQFVDFSLNQWLRRLPPEIVAAHLNLNSADLAHIPADKTVIRPRP